MSLLNNDNSPFRVMLVDDSAVIRSYLKRVISKSNQMEVVAEAENGKLATESVVGAKPDVILLDVEMPIMDGLSALPQLLKLAPNARVIMVSTLTRSNAEISIKAMSMGASDYLEKPSANSDADLFEKTLALKISALASAARKKSAITNIESPLQKMVPLEPEKKTVQPSASVTSPSVIDKPSTIAVEPGVVKTVARSSARPKVLAVGCSTGGPEALVTLFEGLKNGIGNYPIFITQHMPPKFTTFLAERISNCCGVKCFEPQDGHIVAPGEVYLAPGDYHMVLSKSPTGVIINLNQEEPENFCRPAVDPMFRSIAKVYGNEVLALIMTGMGQDGLLGSKNIIEAGGDLIAQDEASSVVWGMPGAVANEGICSQILPLKELASTILGIMK